MKILYITDQFYQHGGIEKILAAKINSLVRDYGFTVHLLTSGQKGQPFVYELDSKMVHQDLGINYVEHESFFSKTNLTKKIRHWQLLKTMIKVISPDIIISPAFSHDQYFLPWIAPGIPKIKEVHFSGSILPRTWTAPSAMSLAVKAFARFDRVVLLNGDEKRYFPGLNLAVIPNFVDCAPQAAVVSREKTVIAAGRLAPVKQLDHLLKAWSMIEDRFPEWQLKIYGDGEQNYVEGLKQSAAALGLKRATFPGSVHNLAEIMAASSVFAMSSANECFPMVLLEAKCAGLPAVSYDCPNGPRNIIRQHRDGILVPPNAVDELASALSRTMSNDALRHSMSEEAMKNSSEFSKTKVMSKWITLFESLAQKSLKHYL